MTERSPMNPVFEARRRTHFFATVTVGALVGIVAHAGACLSQASL